MFSLSFYQQQEYALIASAARNLLSLITGTLGQEQQVQVQGQGQSQSQSFDSHSVRQTESAEFGTAQCPAGDD